MGKDVLGTVYETLLCSPGMNESVKIDLKVNRKTVLLLSSVIERGLNLKTNADQAGVVSIIPPESVEDIRQLAKDCLNKAGLVELSEKMKEIEAK
jgi:hypothetical protein